MAWDGRVPVLLIGGGMISQDVILPTLFQEQDRGVVGKVSIASRRASTLRKVRELFPSYAFQGYPDPDTSHPEASFPDSYKAALDDLDPHGVVMVATPDHLHTEMILEAIERGHHVVVQKPLCLKVADVYTILTAAENKGIYVYTDYHKRHDRAIRAAQRYYRQGHLGEMLHGHAWIEERREMPLDIFSLWAEESSPFEYIGVHYADAYYYITGLKPARVWGFGQKKFLPTQGQDAFDAVQGVIEWTDGSVLWVQTSWVCAEANSSLTNQGLQLSGTQGEYWADHKDRKLHFVTQDKGFEHFNPNFFKQYEPWDGEGTEYVGYGYDSVMQGVHDARRILRETEGMDAAQALQVRRGMLAELAKKRPLPQQAVVGTAIAEAVRLSIDHSNRAVTFDELLYPVLA